MVTQEIKSRNLLIFITRKLIYLFINIYIYTGLANYIA